MITSKIEVKERAKWTPGPWKVSPANGTLCAWRIESETQPSAQAVAFVAQTVGDNRIENENARLIAAAPELYEALLALYLETKEYIELNQLGDAHHNQSMKDALAALRKARGE